VEMTESNEKCKLCDCINKLYAIPHRGCLAWTGLFLFVLFGVFITVIDPMFRGATDPTLMDLQLTFNAQRFHEIIVSWSKSVNGGVDIYKLSTIFLDYLYPIIYSVMLAFGYAAVRGNITPNRFDRVMFVFPFIAAFFDYSENTFHILLLRNVHNLSQAFATYYSDLAVALSFICSVLKFFFSYVAILVLIGAIFYRLKKKYI
jgi:hypothetical protein